MQNVPNLIGPAKLIGFDAIEEIVPDEHNEGHGSQRGSQTSTASAIIEFPITKITPAIRLKMSRRTSSQT